MSWAEKEPASSLAGKRFLVDPGHAVRSPEGKVVNPGTIVDGVAEREIALSVSEKVARLLRRCGAQVKLTRSRKRPWRTAQDADSDNEARAVEANEMKADLFLRIHTDWNRNRKVAGLSVFYLVEKDRALAVWLAKDLSRRLGRKNLGARPLPLVGFVHSRVPAVLIELGFLSNRAERRWLADPKTHRACAEAIVASLEEYYSEK